jgi:hypothetical protein
MKNQNDLIWSIVSLVLALIVAGVCFGTKRDPIAPPAPATVNTSKPSYPASIVVMGNALPNAGTAANAPGGGGSGQLGMGPPPPGGSESVAISPNSGR